MKPKKMNANDLVGAWDLQSKGDMGISHVATNVKPLMDFYDALAPQYADVLAGLSYFVPEWLEANVSDSHLEPSR